MFRRRVVAGVAATCIVLAGGASVVLPAPAIAGSTVDTSHVAWGTCPSATLRQAGAQCGYVSVPLDYAHPDGRHISLAISRVRHTVPASQYQGVMLVNPGGPGGSGLDLATLGQYVPHSAGNSYDWIGFDPRGVGSSKPALSCLPFYFHGDRTPYEPTPKVNIKIWLARSKKYAEACGRNNGPLLQHMKTTDSAKDMDRIRRALGQPQINYYGFSYGTYLGQVYTTLFPTHVRRMVLDSNVDPRYVWYVANLHQDIAFERNINIWFAWIAKYNSVYHLGKTAAAVERLWYAQRKQLTASPAGGVVGPDEWTDIFLLAGYYQATWLDLGKLFADWVHRHDVRALVAAFRSVDTPGNDNGFAVYLAVQCTDVQWPQSWAKWRRDNDRVAAKAPFETWGNVWFNAPCLFWPAKAGKPVSVDGDHVRALLIDETLDAATPYEGSLEVRRLFPDSALLAEPGGTTHAGSLFGDACVDGTVARYLATGALPARKAGNNRADKYCKPLPTPVPTGTAATAEREAAGKRPLVTVHP